MVVVNETGIALQEGEWAELISKPNVFPAVCAKGFKFVTGSLALEVVVLEEEDEDP